jgi:hypothetical protein
MKAFMSLDMRIGMEEVMRIFRTVGTSTSGKAAVPHVMHFFSSDFPGLFGGKELDFEQTAAQLARANGTIEFGEFHCCLLKLSLDVSRDESFKIFEEALSITCNSSTVSLPKSTGVSVSALSAFIRSRYPDLLSRKKRRALSTSLPIFPNPLSIKKPPQTVKPSSSLSAIRSTEKDPEAGLAVTIDSTNKTDTAGPSMGSNKKRPQSAKLSSSLSAIRLTKKDDGAVTVDKTNQGDSSNKTDTAGPSMGSNKMRPQSAKLSSSLSAIRSTEKDDRAVSVDKSNQVDSSDKADTAGTSMGSNKKRPQSAKLSS